MMIREMRRKSHDSDSQALQDCNPVGSLYLTSVTMTLMKKLTVNATKKDESLTDFQESKKGLTNR